jgi:nitrate reductase beta subunit
MNADQRKFLVERVNKTFSNQSAKIQDTMKLSRPSLNNYLIACFLDNSIQFNDIEALKIKMRNTVLKMGVSDSLIKENGSWNRQNSETVKHICEVEAEDLFIIPQSYKDALAEYESEKLRVEREINELEAQKDTILLKIQIGSNSVLDKLITQVDNLADLNIMNSQFLLTQ